VGVSNCAEFLGISLEDSARLWSSAPAEAFGIELPTLSS
jgi:hypothetical protein